MNIYNLISTQPKCSICNQPMKEWDFWAEYHSHWECEADKVSDAVLEVIKKEFYKELNKININKMESRFRVGQRIKITDEYEKEIIGHIVLILRDSLGNRIYYCSMYPGALSSYHWVDVVDLNCIGLDNEGKINTSQALNIFTEDRLELVNGQTH